MFARKNTLAYLIENVSEEESNFITTKTRQKHHLVLPTNVELKLKNAFQ
jgi:hypothetical protein